MVPRKIVAAVRDSLKAIHHPRYFETERGYQGALLAELSSRIKRILPSAIVEQENQKTLMVHQITNRPDLVIHEPFDPNRHEDVTKGNHAVILLKLKASASRAKSDFSAIRKIMTKLNYPLAFFVNVGSLETHIAAAPDNLPGTLVTFGVELQEGEVRLKTKRI